MKKNLLLFGAILWTGLLLSACQSSPAVQPPPEQLPQTPAEEVVPEKDVTAEEEDAAEEDPITPEDEAAGEDPITPEEGAQVLQKLLGEEDEATGNLMSYGYEGPYSLNGTDYYNYRVSWLVDGDHLSYLTNYLVSLDGLTILEAPAA